MFRESGALELMWCIQWIHLFVTCLWLPFSLLHIFCGGRKLFVSRPQFYRLFGVLTNRTLKRRWRHPHLIVALPVVCWLSNIHYGIMLQKRHPSVVVANNYSAASPILVKHSHISQNIIGHWMQIPAHVQSTRRALWRRVSASLRATARADRAAGDNL